MKDCVFKGIVLGVTLFSIMQPIATIAVENAVESSENLESALGVENSTQLSSSKEEVDDVLTSESFSDIENSKSYEIISSETYRTTQSSESARIGETVQSSDSIVLEDPEIITEETNSEMGSMINDIYQDEDTLSRLRANLEKVYAGETNRPNANFVDVSSHNGNISIDDYKEMQKFGITGVVVKMTEGRSYLNPLAKSQVNNALAAGMKVSVYHFAHYTNSSTAQAEAEFFAKEVSELNLSKSVNLVIDIESSEMYSSSLNNNTSAFKNQLNQSGYNNVYYYMSKSWLDTAGGHFSTSVFGNRNIWIAQYPYSPTANQKWNSDKAAWQWSCHYYIRTISSHAFDINHDYTGAFSYSANDLIEGATYHFRNSLTSGVADMIRSYGYASDDVYFGDWDGDGIDGIALRRGSSYSIINNLNTGKIDKVIIYGKSNDTVIVGDWDGDGTDTFAVRRGPNYHIRNSISSGVADKIIVYGKTNDEVYVGDWNGNGIDTLMVRRGKNYFIKNSISSGIADKVIAYGWSSDTVLIGDWNGDGSDSLAVKRGSSYLLRNSLTSGIAEKTIIYGRSSDSIYVGDWNGDNIDTFVVRR